MKALERRCAIITGASRGLGLEIASSYLRAGASVMLCARGTATLQQAQRALLPLAGDGQSVLAMPADVSKPAEVAALVAESIERLGRVDILVSNAGTAGPLGPLEHIDPLEWMRTVEVNLLGPLLLCRALLPHFKQLGRGKIIQVSGGGATQPLPNLSAYAASKAAVIRFTETLAEETRTQHIDVNALAPGALNTRMLDEFLAAGPECVGHEFYQRALRQKESGGVPLARGAALAVFLGSTRSDGITGRLISAVWDPWERLPERLPQLLASDIYTLRRILPRDRAQSWGERD